MVTSLPHGELQCGFGECQSGGAQDCREGSARQHVSVHDAGCIVMVPHGMHAVMDCHDEPFQSRHLTTKLHPCALSARRRVSYAQEGQLFHVLVAEGITFLCMADEVRL